LRFQKDGLAKAKEAWECRRKSRVETFCAEEKAQAGLASGAKKDRERRRERTIRSCIAH